MAASDQTSKATISTFAKAFREARLKAGLTQKNVAAISKVTVNHISSIERGTNPNITEKTMQALASAVGMQLEVRLTPQAPQRKKP